MVVTMTTVSSAMTKKCYNCKYWTECSHNHGSSYLGNCYHPSTYNTVINGDETCCNWEDKVTKEFREIETYIEWLVKNSDKLSFDLETKRHVGSDYIYTVTHKETKQSLRVCKSSNGHYSILQVNGYDVRNRYNMWSDKVKEVFNYIDSFVKKVCNTEDDKVQQAIDSFKA